MLTCDVTYRVGVLYSCRSNVWRSYRLITLRYVTVPGQVGSPLASTETDKASIFRSERYSSASRSPSLSAVKLAIHCRIVLYSRRYVCVPSVDRPLAMKVGPARRRCRHHCCDSAPGKHKPTQDITPCPQTSYAITLCEESPCSAETCAFITFGPATKLKRVFGHHPTGDVLALEGLCCRGVLTWGDSVGDSVTPYRRPRWWRRWRSRASQLNIAARPCTTNNALASSAP